MKRFTLSLVAAAVLVLSFGCGESSSEPKPEPTEHVVDYVAWKAQLDTLMGHPVDFPEMMIIANEDCAKKDLGYLIALAMDSRNPKLLDVYRINFANVCPERSSEIEDIVSDLSD